MRIPVALRDAAAIAVAELGAASSVTTLTTDALRARLEAIVMEAALAEHYTAHPELRPSLAELAIAAATLDGNPLAERPGADPRGRHGRGPAPAGRRRGRRPALGRRQGGRRRVSRLILLDKEAVQALMDHQHRHHRRVLALLDVVAARRKRALPIEIAVPTAVRVEAGWGRRRPEAALINRLRIRDCELTRAAGDIAAEQVSEHGVAVADAHLGAVLAARRDDAEITVVTSDADDLRVVAGSAPVTVFRL